MAAEFLKSKFFAFTGLVILIMTIVFLGRELQERYRIRREIKGLEQEIAFHEQRNTELLKFINYFKTPEYRERQARSLLNLQKTGEFAVALPTSSTASVSSPLVDKGQQHVSNLELWWEYFFSK